MPTGTPKNPRMAAKRRRATLRRKRKAMMQSLIRSNSISNAELVMENRRLRGVISMIQNCLEMLPEETE